MPLRAPEFRSGHRGVSASLLASLALATLAVTPARAGFPPVFDWSIPSQILVVGEDANGVADPLGEFTVVIRDIVGQPVGGVLVIVEFANCSDVRLAVDQRDPDAILNCGNRSVAKTTDGNGTVRFRIVGSSSASPGGPGSPTGCAAIYADGILGGNPRVAILDLAGSDGLAPADISAWLDDFFGPYQPERADYDGNQVLGAGDLSKLLDAFFAAGSTTNLQGGGACSP